MSKPENPLTAYGGTVLKMLGSLALGDVKGVFDGTVDLASIYRSRKAGTQQNLAPLQTIQQDILKQLTTLAEQMEGEINIEMVAAQAEHTLQCGFSFKSLTDNWRDSQAVVQAWSKANQKALTLVTGHERNFHDALLTQTVDALWDRLHEMPGFITWFIGDLRQQNQEHQQSDRNLAQEQARLSVAIKELVSAKDAAFLAFEPQYRAAVVKELDWVELFIERPDLEEISTKQMLSVVYVTLTLARGRFEEEASGDVSAESLLDSLPADTPCALIVGPAGCGKTTLLRWAAIEAARVQPPADHPDRRVDRQEKRPQRRADARTWRNKIPFFVRLRDFPTGAFPAPNALHCHGASRLNAPEGWAESVLKAGRGLLLLDGLDELSAAQRRRALTWIQGFIDDYGGGNVFVATSRPEALKPGALEQAQFAEYNVRNLTPEGKRQFVRRWHRAVARQLGGSRKKLRELAGKRRQLLRELETNRSAAHLAANPLLCALLCALNRVYRSSLPKNMRDLCESACKMLMWDRDRLNEVRALDSLPAYSALNEDMRILLARNLAYDVVSKELDTTPRESAIVQIADALNPGGAQDRNRAEEALQGLLERSGLLRECRNNDVEFVHNALRDYLASLMFARRQEYAFLAKKVESENLARWEPVLLFAAAVRHDEEFGSKLVQAILELPDGSAKNKYRRDVMALKTAVCVRYPLSLEVTAKLDAIRAQMLPVKTVEQANALAECGEIAIEHLAWRCDMAEEVETACARGLAKMNSAEAVAALQKFLRRDAPPAVLDELATVLPAAVMAQTVNVLTIPSVLLKLQESYHEPKEYRPYVHDLTPLSGMSSLQKLCLDYTQIKDFKLLANLSNLQTLSLDDTQIKDFELLAKLSNLQELYLNNTQITDLTPLKGLSGLHTLSLEGTHVEDLTPLVGLDGLQTLSLENTHFKDLTQLAMLSNLQWLSLESPRITHFELLANLSNLQWLSLDNTQIKDLTPLDSLTGLHTLHLNNTYVPAAELERFEAICRARGQKIIVYWSEVT